MSEKKKIEYSKKWIAVILVCSLAFTAACIALGRETLGCCIFDGSVVLMLGYFVKAFFGKKNEVEAEINREALERLRERDGHNEDC